MIRSKRLNSKEYLSIILLLLITIISTQSQCQPSYQYLDFTTSTCMPCGYSCQLCANSYTCDTCMDEYYLNNSTNICQKCQFGCMYCTSSTTCITCNIGLYIDSSGNCLPCTTGVSSCTIAVVDSCQGGYFLLSGICGQCLDNCYSCMDFITCTTCNKGYYLAANSQSCLACSINCLICSNSTTCTECSLGYLINVNGQCVVEDCSMYDFCTSCNAGGCTACERGKYLDSSSGSCLQGASILCLQSSGPYYTNCDISNGCTVYSSIQYDPNTGIPRSVCMPYSATQTSQYIYSTNLQSNCLSSTCGLSYSQILIITTRKSYYQVQFNLNIRLYKASQHTINISAINSTTQSIAATIIQTISIVNELNVFSQTQPDCSNCPYGQVYISGTLSSNGYQQSLFSIIDQNGAFTIVEYVFVFSTCQVDNCQTCTIASDCTLCIQPFYLQSLQCVTQCDSGYYLYQRSCLLLCPTGTFAIQSSYQCQVCNSPCITCISSTQCTSCITGYFLQGQSCVTNCSSTQLFGNTTSHQCQQCPNPCQTCYAINSTYVRCLTCMAGYLYNQSSCVYVCPSAYYTVFVNEISQCQTCDSSCLQCYISNSTCSSCMSGYLLYGSYCNSTTTCLSGYFISTNNTCGVCQFPCATCQGQSTNCTSCRKGGLYQNKCHSSCPSGYFMDYTVGNNITCQACSANCSTCLSLTACQSCVNGYYLLDTQCLSSCTNLSYYANSINNNCTLCFPPCKQCTSPTNCLSCLTGYLDGTTCTLQCNSSSYINSAFICTLCPSPCTQCYSQSQCIQCLLPNVLNVGSCISVSECQALGMYVSYTMDSTNTTQLYGECKQCTYPCASCTISPIFCSTCIAGYLYLSDLKTCQQQCPSTYYMSSNQCLKCSSNCYECLGQATNCTSCSTGTYLQSVGNSCVGQCPDGYYADNDQQSCRGCVAPCATCYNVYFCKTCSVGIYYNKVCVTTCPSGTLYDSITNQCSVCTNNCLTCEITTSNCTSCISGYYLNSDGNCTLTCQSGYYADSYMQACEACVSPCSTCISQTSCINCVTNYYLSGGINCVLTCPNQYFANSTTFTCDLCNLTICDTCNLTANNCLSCANGYFFDSLSLSCLITCPSGYYPDSITRTCKICQFPCAICINSSYCTQCQINYKLYLNRCYSSCPVGYYGTTACQQCPTNCQICTSQISCSKCTTNYYVQNGICVTNCSTGLYKGKQDITNYDYCLQCPSNCQKCTDYTTCLLCDSGFYLFNGLCLIECPILHYAQNTTMSCSSCPSNCVACVNSTYCTQCINSYVYQHQCVSECPSKTYVFNQIQCIQCVSPCDQCLSQYQCVTCVSGYMYYHGYCVKKCPSGVWYYPSNNTCSSDCPYNKYQSNLTCYLSGCGISTMVVLNGYCLQSCPLGYYVSQQSTCISCTTNPTICKDLFIADLQILRSQQLSISLYYSQQAQIISSVDEVNVTFTNQNGQIVKLNLSTAQFTSYELLMKYEYESVEYLNVELTIPYINSMTTQQAISQCYYTAILYYFNNYSHNPTSPLFIISSIIPLIISIGLVICIICNLISKSSYFLQLLDFMQLTAACLYLDIQYPQYLERYLEKLGLTMFSFMPKIMQHQPYAFSTAKFIFYNVDASLTRTHLVTLIVFLVLLGVMGVVVLVDKFVTPLPKLINRVKYRWINDAFSIFALPLMLFAFPFAHAIIIDIILGVIVILLTVMWVIFISNLIIQAKQMGDLLGLLSDYEAVSNKLGLMYTPFSYIRKIIVALLFANFPEKPLADLTLLLIFTILILICLFFYEPFASRVTDYVSMSLEFTLIIFIILLVLIGLDIFSETANNVIASLAIILVLITMAVALGWLFYLTFGSMKKFIQNPQKEDEKDTENCVKQEKKSHDSHGQEQPKPKQGEHSAQQSAANLISPSRQKFRQSNINDGNESDNHSRSNKEEFKHWNDEDQEVSEFSNKQKGNIKGNKSSGLPEMLMKKKINEDHQSEEQFAKQK